jgi:hypothetical protein
MRDALARRAARLEDEHGAWRGGLAFSVADVGFAITGLTKDPQSGFNAETLIADAISRHHGIWQVTNAVEKEIHRAITLQLQHLATDDPMLFSTFRRSVASGNRLVTSALVGALDGGVPVAVHLEVNASQESDGRIVVSTSRQACPGADCPTGGIFILGRRGPIDDYEKIHGGYPKMPATALGPFLVQLVSDAGVLDVGAPVDVLVISTSGVSRSAVKSGWRKCAVRLAATPKHW